MYSRRYIEAGRANNIHPYLIYLREQFRVQMHSTQNSAYSIDLKFSSSLCWQRSSLSTSPHPHWQLQKFLNFFYLRASCLFVKGISFVIFSLKVPVVECLSNKICFPGYTFVFSRPKAQYSGLWKLKLLLRVLFKHEYVITSARIHLFPHEKCFFTYFSILMFCEVFTYRYYTMFCGIFSIIFLFSVFCFVTVFSFTRWNLMALFCLSRLMIYIYRLLIKIYMYICITCFSLCAE